MRTKFGSLTCLGGWALSLAGGCDEQVAPAYTGESLLTVTGSVEIANSRSFGELLPALGFRIQNTSAIKLVDVPVRGAFPSDFRIELYEPPPKSTLHHPTRQEQGEPLVSVGYITAVPSDHPDMLYTGNSAARTYYGCMDEGRPDNLCLTETTEICTVPNPDNIPCYVEKRFCPMDSSDDSDLCIVETSGDPTLTLSDVTSLFPGLSQNYQVIYLAEAAAAGSVTATWLEAEAGVPAGYGLYEVQRVTPDESCSSEDGPAWELVTRYYNEAHQTNYKNLRCRGLEADPPHCRMPPPQWDLEGRTGALGEINRLLEKAQIELGCPLGYFHYKRVEDPASTVISIVIDSEPPMPLVPPTQP